MQSFLSPPQWISTVLTGSNYSLRALQMSALGDIFTEGNGLLNPLSGQAHTYRELLHPQCYCPLKILPPQLFGGYRPAVAVIFAWTVKRAWWRKWFKCSKMWGFHWLYVHKLRAVTAHAWKNVHCPVHMTVTQFKVWVSRNWGGPKDSLTYKRVLKESSVFKKSWVRSGVCLDVLLSPTPFVKKRLYLIICLLWL